MPSDSYHVVRSPDEALKRFPCDEVLFPRMADWARAGHSLVIVCDIDLDRFGELNQRLGRAGGNAGLAEAARRIQAELPRESLLAHIGGDEFAAIFAGVERAQCHAVLERILVALAEPWQWQDHTVQLAGSLGARVMEGTGQAPELALRDAQHAAFFAKRAGDGKVHYFNAAQAEADAQAARERQRIREGLARGEFFLCYQPKVDMRRGVVVGAEALIRWRHPERGLLHPNHFVPLLEDDTLAERVGQWVIDTALRQLAEWRKGGLHLSVSVNVSPLHMMRHDFVERLTAQLAQYPKLGPGALELEILETAAISQLATMARLVEACRTLGVGVALDDFGTGYSSLSYLRHLPVSSVKIDQSFIRDMLDSEPDRAIVHGILLLLKALGRTAVAEGVETQDHGEALLAMGCTLVQGYGIAKPMPADHLKRWVAEFERAPPWARARAPEAAPKGPTVGHLPRTA